MKLFPRNLLAFMVRMGSRPERARRAFGTAVIAFGIVTLIWPSYYDWLQLHLTGAAGGRAFSAFASVAQIAGGLAIQFPRSVKLGSALICANFLTVALLSTPRIVGAPQIYDVWGDFFEQFSLAVAAAIVFAESLQKAPKYFGVTARVLFGLCIASFGTEQAVYLSNTATLVPEWLPPGQMFWAVVTTLSFYLTTVALFANRLSLLATRLFAIMIAAFGAIVWLPLLAARPHSMSNWSETVETFAIAGAAWVLAEALRIV